MKETIDKSLVLLDFVINESENTRRYFHKEKCNHVTMFCLCMIDRLQASSVGLKTLLKQALETEPLEYSCGIILRSFFLDFIILLNAMEKNNNGSPEDLRNFCFSMLADSVKIYSKNIEELYSQAPKEKRQKMYAELVSRNPDFFEVYNNDGTCPIPQKADLYRNKDLISNIRQSSNLAKYQGVYEGYLFYSKYDHFGQMSYRLLQEDFVTRLHFLTASISHIPHAFLYAHEMLTVQFPEDEFLVGQCDSGRKFLGTNDQFVL